MKTKCDFEIIQIRPNPHQHTLTLMNITEIFEHKKSFSQGQMQAKTTYLHSSKF